MYRVALLQNQSEAFELSYGDVFSWFERTFHEYHWDLFSTDKSMSTLFERLDETRYDAVVFTSNTFNDMYLERAWSGQAALVERFLAARKGMLVFQQIKVVDRELPMLPPGLSLRVLPRPPGSAEAPRMGSLSVAEDHELLHYPAELDVGEVFRASQHNQSIEYLYWTILEAQHPEHWSQVLVDDSYPAGRRPLLLVTGPQTLGRLVVTSMVLDWQRQLDAVRNLLTFVVEGHHGTAVVRRRHRASYDFEYLLESLRIAKHPFREYDQDTLDFTALRRGIHDLVVLDPAWPPSEITKSQLAIFRSCMKPESRLIYFDTESLGEPAVTAVGGVLPFWRRHQESVIYLKEAFDRDGGRWDGSYFSTIYVLEMLRAIGEPLTEYREPFLRYIDRHDQDGSYDAQFATTCALLKVYYWLLGEDDGRFKRTLGWLQRELDTKVRNPGDQARAYLAMKECRRPVALDRVRSLGASLTPLSTISEDEIIRYIAVFLAYGLLDQAMPWVSRLVETQRGDGSWGSEEQNRLFLTALVADLLLSARSAIGAGRASGKLDQAILSAAIHLKSVSTVSVGHRDRASTIAAVLVALRHFEASITFPIDDFLEQQGILEEGFRVRYTVETAARLIGRLQDSNVRVAQELRETQGHVVRSRQVGNILGYVLFVCIPLLVLCLYVLGRDVVDHGVQPVLRPVMALDRESIAWLGGLCLVVLAILARRRIIPDRLRRGIGAVVRFVASPVAAFDESWEVHKTGGE